MKTKWMMAGLLALGVSAGSVLAQDDGGGPRPPGPPPPQGQFGGGPGGGPGFGPGAPGGDRMRGPRQLPPVIEALDANQDGVIDEKEIKNASKALLKLDKNGDGKLTLDELRPPMPAGMGPAGPGGGPGFVPGGQAGQGGQGGPGGEGRRGAGQGGRGNRAPPPREEAPQ